MKQAPLLSKVVIGRRWGEIHTDMPAGSVRPHSSPLHPALLSVCLLCQHQQPQGCQQMLCCERTEVSSGRANNPPYTSAPAASRSYCCSGTCLGSRFPHKPGLVSDFSLILQLPFPDFYLPSCSPNYVRSISYNKCLIP